MTLTNIIIKSYSSILITIGSAATFFFMLGTYFIIKLSRGTPEAEADVDVDVVTSEPRSANIIHPRKPRKVSEKTMLSEAMNDVSAISGEDPFATQLDLAKAYIESDKGPLAKIILTAVIREGNSPYQEEAQRLLRTI